MACLADMFRRCYSPSSLNKVNQLLSQKVLDRYSSNFPTGCSFSHEIQEIRAQQIDSKSSKLMECGFQRLRGINNSYNLNVCHRQKYSGTFLQRCIITQRIMNMREGHAK